ncbi:hypothetical protein PAL_GLEAN10000193 [Pteropus alecto]|uniref:Cysteine-rich DPF motif domain-containing protein 1 n=1 Tax=Pteropus alecto TaxID=9402 RepID=L5L2X5_PTEAL|nr:hypothetical protein PAL_GLEAN10000193 [Pteropus alecto]
MACESEHRPLGVFECQLCALTAPYSYVGQKPQHPVSPVSTSVHWPKKPCPEPACLSLTRALGIGFRPTLPTSGRFTVARGGTGQGSRAIQLFLNLRAPSFQLSLESSTFSSWGSSTVTQAGTAQQLGVNGAAAGACSILLVVCGKPACLWLLQWWE